MVIPKSITQTQNQPIQNIMKIIPHEYLYSTTNNEKHEYEYSL